MKTHTLYLILVISVFYSCNPEKEYNKDEKTVQNALSQLNIKFDTTTIFLFIPSNTCLGCRNFAIEQIKILPVKNKVFIITSDISFHNIKNREPLYIIVDKNKVIDRNVFLKEKITMYLPFSKKNKIKQFNPINVDSISLFIKSQIN